MTPKIYTLNQIGQRENVEDFISSQQPGMPPVFIVCDGVGGNNFGEVASQKAVESFYQTLSTQYINIQNLASFRKCIGHALFKFTTSMQDFIIENPVGKNASSTLTAVLLKNGVAYLAWCGDSRIYHIRKGEILYRTKDHSLVQELVNNNVITEQEAIVHPQKNVITKSLHAHTDQDDIELHEIRNVQAGDFLLLCTDGLLEQFTEERLKETLIAHPGDETPQYDKLIDEICAGKTHDNYSMILVQYPPVKKRTRWFALVAALILAGALGYFFLFGGKRAATQEAVPVKNEVRPDSTALSPDTTVQKRSGFKTLSDTGDNKKVDTKKPVKPLPQATKTKNK